MVNLNAGLELIEGKRRIVALTGAGVSVSSGIPDYRSVKGVYQGIEQPEYLLSRTCLINEPTKFYQFVKNLYRLEATPNLIHDALKTITSQGGVVTQNIDQLHQKVETAQLVEYHGSLYRCYCMDCFEVVSVESYLHSDRHETCGGQLRPDIVLYEEGLPRSVIEESQRLLSQADLVLIVGTSFQVSPFCHLIDFTPKDVDVLVINDEDVYLNRDYYFFKGKAETFFKEYIAKEEKHVK